MYAYEYMHAPLCSAVMHRFVVSSGDPDLQDVLRIRYMTEASDVLGIRALRRLMSCLGLPYPEGCKLHPMRKLLKEHIQCIKRGKNHVRPHCVRNTCADWVEYEQRLGAARSSWPRRVDQAFKDKIVQLFQESTSSAALRRSPCACCGELVSVNVLQDVTFDDLPLEILTADDYLKESPISCSFPFKDGPLTNVLLHLNSRTRMMQI